MDPGAIFAKTAKGREEISQRTHRLPQRLRTLLVIVDGQTTAAEHRAKCKGLGDVAGMLTALAEQGFIADVRTKAAAAPASGTAAEAAERSLEAALRFAVDRFLNRFNMTVLVIVHVSKSFYESLHPAACGGRKGHQIPGPFRLAVLSAMMMVAGV